MLYTPSYHREPNLQILQSQGCQQTFSGAQCFCSQGYQLEQDGKTCTQLGGGGGNSCNNNNGGCEQVCSPNQFGGPPQCACTRGYVSTERNDNINSGSFHTYVHICLVALRKSPHDLHFIKTRPLLQFCNDT